MQTLPADLALSHAEIQRLWRQVEYLEEELRLTRAKYFGRSSEKRPLDSPPNQILLFPPPEQKEAAEHLRREDTIIDKGEGEIVLEKITERLAANDTPFFVKRIIRRIRKKDGVLLTLPLPPPVIEGTTADISFLVYVLIAKYVWHLPLYRQEQILKSQGIQLSRDTMIRYVIAIASLLKPIYVALGVELFAGEHLYGDETPVQVGKTKAAKKSYETAWFWTFVGSAGCIFHYSSSRAYKEVEPLLKTYSGYLQCDGYQVYEKLAATYPEITLVSCWSHARRKFVDAEQGGNVADSKEALRYIRALYRVERRIREQGLKPPEILYLRQRFSKGILALFDRWLRRRAQDPTLLPKSLFGKALNYTRERWKSLSRYIEDPALAIDSNIIEREIRPVALGKKNWLFCASETGAEASAISYSLIASCRLAGVDPATYFTDVLDRISTHPASKVAELIPLNWKHLILSETVSAALPAKV